jgi:acyl-CoA oxidase
MSPTPDWVKQLKPSGPQGSELLQRERDQSDISVGKLSELLHTKEVLERRTRGRVERLTGSLARAKQLRQLKLAHNWSDEEVYTANELVGEPTVYALHASMFLVRRSYITLSPSPVELALTVCQFVLENDPGSGNARAAQALP